MKKKQLVIFSIAVTVIFAGISLMLFYKSYSVVSKEFKETMGDNAVDMAMIISNSITITDADVKNLKRITYKELPDNELNRELDALVGELPIKEGMRFVYVATILDKDEIKFSATEKSKKLHSAPVGTPLNMIWLLDVPCEKNERNYVQTEEGFNDYYSEDERFSCLQEGQKEIFKNEEPTYEVTDDGWGKFLTGYAPLYTEEGNYVGMVGIDIFLDKYVQKRGKPFYNVIMMICLIYCLIGFLIIIIYYKYLMAENRAKYGDALTGAHNRRFLNELLQHELKKKKFVRNKYLLFMMIDFDDFKKVNDTYGHAKGDCCLKMMKSVFDTVYSSHEGILMRFGGEEFLGVSCVSSIKEGKITAESLLAAVRISDPMKNGKQITISIGGYLVPPIQNKEYDIEEYIKAADENLYKAKKSGKNCACLSTFEDAQNL